MKAAGTLSWRIARQMIRHAGKVLPAGKQDWAQAMGNELTYLPDGSSALRWAAGCLLASYRQRLSWLMSACLSISRPVLALEMLFCFGFLSVDLSGMLLGAEHAMPFRANLFSLLALSSCLSGPLGLIFTGRYLLYGQLRPGGFMLTALPCAAGWTLFVNGIVMWLFATQPGHAWAWQGSLLMAVLPALGAAHLMAIAGSAEHQEKAV